MSTIINQLAGMIALLRIPQCLFIFLLFCYGGSYGQSPQSVIYGYAEDSLSAERLVGATVFTVVNGKSITTTTNAYGYFSLTVPGKTAIELGISYVGYRQRMVLLDPSSGKELIIKMEPVSETEQEVTVAATGNRIAGGNIGEMKLTSALIKKMPRFLGDNDPLKVLQTLPGITQGMEGTTGLIVRGGSPDQNLFLLDGTPVYNPAHLGGVFSPFNGDAIKDVTVYKGNFPARFGERLSSVIDLTTKDGNMKKLAGEGSVGMLASKLLLEGPIKKDKSSFMISARRTYWDVLASPFISLTNSDDEKRKLNVYFYDINAKLNYILSNKDRLYASFFVSNDNYKFKTNSVYSYNNNHYTEENRARIGWQNYAGSLRWNHLFSSRMFANTTLYATSYRVLTDFYNNAKEDNATTIQDGRYSSGVKDMGLKSDFEYKANNIHSLRFGLQASYKYFQPGSSSNKTLADGSVIYTASSENGRQQSPELAVYAEDYLRLSEKWNANVGFRSSAFHTGTRWYGSFEPRLSFNYTPVSNLRISGSYSQMRQYIHLLANNSVSLPTDIWVPATNKIRPIHSDQLSLGVNTSVANNGIDIGIEAYYKKLNGVVEYLDGQSYLSSSVRHWEELVEAGKGKAWGIELFLQKKHGRSTGWASYTYSRSTRQFPTINDGQPFDFKYDRPHVLNLVYMFRISARWKASANWTFQSGAPFTIATAMFKAFNQPGAYDPGRYTYPAEYISGRNDFRLLNYHRLDIGLTWSKQKRSFEKYWNFSLYNVYNQKNPMYYYVSNAGLKGTGLFPLIPSISYGFKF